MARHTAMLVLAIVAFAGAANAARTLNRAGDANAISSFLRTAAIGGDDGVDAVEPEVTVSAEDLTIIFPINPQLTLGGSVDLARFFDPSLGLNVVPKALSLEPFVATTVATSPTTSVGSSTAIALPSTSVAIEDGTTTTTTTTGTAAEITTGGVVTSAGGPFVNALAAAAKRPFVLGNGQLLSRLLG
ncbi:MAG: hypothetical protein J3K34DRAFT_488480 [Monoraphidium minutum]|nr:MAG: hypothetical protein J3K34DRAFT_488480 [Monoraphidium minutum]